VGITIRRKLGPAVARNRSRRLLREVFRLHREQVPPGSDLVVAVTKDLSRMKLREVEAAFREMMMKIDSSGRTPEAEGVHGNSGAGEKIPARGN
jgi:ribonuclease P protein component